MSLYYYKLLATSHLFYVSFPYVHINTFRLGALNIKVISDLLIADAGSGK